MATMVRTRAITTGYGSVSRLQFAGDSEDFITSGSDGRVVRWTPAGDRTVLTQFSQPIDKFAAISNSGGIACSTLNGALWRTEAAAQISSLRPAGSRVSQILDAPSQQRVYVGYANGDVIVIDTRSWQQETLLRGFGAIREIAITDDGRTIAVATNDGTIHVGTLRDDALDLAAGVWRTLQARARDIALTRDGLLVASCTDGTIWLYSTTQRRSLCLPTGTVDLGKIAVTDNGQTAIVLDRSGRLLWLDLGAARKLLDTTSWDPYGR